MVQIAGKSQNSIQRVEYNRFVSFAGEAVVLCYWRIGLPLVPDNTFLCREVYVANIFRRCLQSSTDFLRLHSSQKMNVHSTHLYTRTDYKSRTKKQPETFIYSYSQRFLHTHHCVVFGQNNEELRRYRLHSFQPANSLKHVIIHNVDVVNGISVSNKRNTCTKQKQFKQQ